KPRVLSGHDGWVWSVAFSPDGQWLASGSFDGTVRLWKRHQPDAEPCELYRDEKPGKPNLTSWVASVAFSGVGQWLAWGSFDGTVRLWNWDESWCNKGKRGKADLVKLPEQDASGVQHKGGVWSVAFGKDGKDRQWLASGGLDKIVRLWEIPGHNKPPVLCKALPDGGRVWSVAFSPDGQWLASGSDDSAVRLWKADEGTTSEPYYARQPSSEGRIWSVA